MGIRHWIDDMRQRREQRLRSKVKRDVDRGIALLEANGQRGWATHVQTASLCITDDEKCILYQLFGSFEKGKKRLGIKVGGGYGFNCWPWQERRYHAAWTAAVHAPSN